METIPPSHYPATRAASLVANYINHQYGGPSRLLWEGHVTSATREDINGADGSKKRKYNITFPLEDAFSKGIVAVCTAEIIYHLNPKTAPGITYTLDKELAKNPMEGDNAFYTKMKSRKTLLEEGKIPDDFGNRSPEMEPIQRLARAACGYIVWQNATEETKYNMIQIQCVRQVKREDDFLEFIYNVFFHDMVSQEIIPWKLKVVWRPGQAAEVKENSRQPKHCESADGGTHQCG